ELIADPLFQAQMYQAAIVQIAERYMTHIWEQERLDDYGDQAEELYLVRKDLLRLPQRADFTHVLIRSAGTRGELDAMKSIFNIYELLAEERPLAELAAEYSEDPQAEHNSGRYDGVDIDSLDKAVAEVVRQLPPGEISQPFRSELGWHIVELHRRYRREIGSFAQVRERALEVAEQRHRSAVRERILRRLSRQENEFQPGAVESLLTRYETSEQDIEKLKSDIASRLVGEQQE
ncbi:MAG: peptidylprolyl isomerase, partial [Wenzhouxiangellaceae bacterium]